MEKLWYEKPAKFWRQALPIGNGLTGVMIYGGKSCETLDVNDVTLWSGYPKEQNNPNSLAHLDEVRKLVFDGKNKDADKLTMDKLSGGYCEAYVPLGTLKIRIKKADKNDYKRELDLGQAVHVVSTSSMKREAFASYPHKIAVYSMTSEKPFSVCVSAKSKLKSKVVVDDALNLIGNAPDCVVPNYVRTELRPVKYNEGKGMSFCMRVEPHTDGEIVSTKSGIKIKNATNIVFYIATATGFVSYDKKPIVDTKIPLNKCKKTLKAVKDDYKTIKEKHIKDFQKIYKNQDVSLLESSELPTDKLVKMAKGGDVKLALVDLFYHFGKYLTVSGSRKGGQALNLQGIWNGSVRPAWSSNYTANINAQMNYWGIMGGGMADCIEPYVNLVQEISQRGKETAKVNYGCKGFACNHNVDIWRKPSTVKGPPSYMYAPLCGVWLANELYAHYKNGVLSEYKDKIFEIVRQSAMFANDYLVKHEGKYVTCPSASPELQFKNGKDVCSLDYASAFEMGLVKQVFNNYIEFSNDQLASDIKSKLIDLYPFKQGKTGILEWHKDYEVTEKGHRHFSPLYAFYPGRVISYYANKEETQWVKKLFDYRLDNSKQFIGWNAAWAICIAARLHDNSSADRIIGSMLSHSVFYNLFDVHPPFIFQIDGNLGFVAGINEMLVYEENNVLELLPALPADWKNGSVRDMVVNGAKISFDWENGKVVNLSSDCPVKLLQNNFSDKCQIGTNIEFVKI